MEVLNNSGLGKQSSLPPELDHISWNWGAFAFTFIWGIFNKVYFSFLIFIPLFNLIVPFILAFKGNKWAWQNKKWDSVEQFKKDQRIWAIFGLTFFILQVGFVIWVVWMNSHIKSAVPNPFENDPRIQKLSPWQRQTLGL